MKEMKKLRLAPLWLLFGYLMGSCNCGDDHAPLYPYTAKIFYKNSKKQDLLDTTTANHLDAAAILINGNSVEINKMEVGSIWESRGFPTGYCLVKGLSVSRNYSGTNTYFITLSQSLSDTLLCNYSNGKLVECFYNRVDVPNPAGEFPILVIK